MNWDPAVDQNFTTRHLIGIGNRKPFFACWPYNLTVGKRKIVDACLEITCQFYDFQRAVGAWRGRRAEKE